MMGALAGMKVVELVGVGPGPFCGMMLADMGADVVRVCRPDPSPRLDPLADVLARGRPSVAVDLKHPDGVGTVLELVDQAEAVIDPFRPGVMERIGLGPDVCLERNPQLVFGRMTGWGQTGPLANRAGHDINYLARNGILSLIGRKDALPTPPLNLVGDFGGGAMFLVVGVLAAVLHARATGEGQVVDAAMVDGSSLLAAMVHQVRAMDDWRPGRGSNVLDSGAPYYDVYSTSDGLAMSIGSMEPQFYAELLAGLGLADDPLCQQRDDRSRWSAIKERIAEVVRQRSRDDWAATFAHRDACVEPVLSLDEAIEDEHMRDRGTFVRLFGIVQPAPAPRFSRTPSSVRMRPARPGEQSRPALQSWGFDDGRIDELVERGVVHDAS